MLLNANIAKGNIVYKYIIKREFAKKMLEVKTYDQEKNTWNVAIKGKMHEIKIDVWHDIIVDGQKLVNLKDLRKMGKLQVCHNGKLFYRERRKPIFPVDGVMVEYKKRYSWETTKDARAHLLVDGIDLETGEPEPVVREIEKPWWANELVVVLGFNIIFPWAGIVGIAYRAAAAALIPRISALSINEKYSMRKRAIISVAIVIAFLIIVLLMFINGVMGIRANHRRYYFDFYQYRAPYCVIYLEIFHSVWSFLL